jgi:hypothetical protein
VRSVLFHWFGEHAKMDAASHEPGGELSTEEGDDSRDIALYRSCSGAASSKRRARRTSDDKSTWVLPVASPLRADAGASCSQLGKSEVFKRYGVLGVLKLFQPSGAQFGAHTSSVESNVCERSLGNSALLITGVSSSRSPSSSHSSRSALHHQLGLRTRGFEPEISFAVLKPPIATTERVPCNQNALWLPLVFKDE